MDNAEAVEAVGAHIDARHVEVMAAIAALETRTMAAISDLRAYVERIETEANDMMKGMTDPGELLKRFMG